jgi:hypothetical protein
MRKPPGELLVFLRRYDAGVQAVAMGLREVVLDEMAPCHEHIFTMRGRVVLLYGPTTRVIEDCVCMIGVYRKHANLQFTHGIDLSDPQGLLEGRGTRMRHIKIRKLSDLDRQEIREFLRQARRNAGMTRSRSKGAEVITSSKAPREGEQRGRRERFNTEKRSNGG